MIIVDTNVWIDHLKETDPTLTVILDEIRQRVHPFVIGELSLGNVRDRSCIIALLEAMPQAEVALHEDSHGTDRRPWPPRPRHRLCRRASARLGEAHARHTDLDTRQPVGLIVRSLRIVVPAAALIIADPPSATSPPHLSKP